MTTRQTPDAVREAIIAAIAKADANFGYSYRLTKMDDAGEEHTLFMDGFEPAVFPDREDGYRVIEQRRNAARTDDILAALDSRAGDAGEVALLRAALNEIDQIAGTTIPTDGNAAAWSALEAIIRLIHPFRTNGQYPPRATPAPAVGAVPAGEVEQLRGVLEQIATHSNCDWDQVRKHPEKHIDIIHEIAVDALFNRALSHGEGRK